VGTVQISAAATLVAALIALLGSIGAVWVSARLQTRAQRRQWDRDARAYRSQAILEACLRFDGAVTVAAAGLHDLVDVATSRQMRRATLGREWARSFYAQVQTLSVQVALPYRAVHVLASGPIREAADTVMTELGTFSQALTAKPANTAPAVAEKLTAARQRFADTLVTVGPDGLSPSSEPGRDA